VSQDSPDPAVQALAAEFAEEEQEHLTLLEQWLARMPEEDDEPAFDPDPPHSPD
jgi:rubrerythrin